MACKSRTCRICGDQDESVKLRRMQGPYYDNKRMCVCATCWEDHEEWLSLSWAGSDDEPDLEDMG